jgi:hypothetical protein
MDFDTFYHKLHENIDTSNYINKYQNFGQKLKEYFNISSHEDSFVEIKMAAYFNSGILYKFCFRTINKTKTLKKIIKLVNNKIFEIKDTTDSNNHPAKTVEVVYLFKDIKKMLDRQVFDHPAPELNNI